MSELMSGGFTLMIMGMCTVFIFLALLVIGTNIMSTVIRRFFPEPVVANAAPVRSQADNSEVLAEVAAVAAAVKLIHKD